jgi:hypothetical protein
VTTTEHPVTPATVAEWRRRKEADGGLPPDGHNGQPANGHNGQSANGRNGQSANGHHGQPANGQSANGHNRQPANGHNGQPANGHNGQSANGQAGKSANGHGEQPRNGYGGPPPGEEAKIRNGYRVPAYAAEEPLLPTPRDVEMPSDGRRAAPDTASGPLNTIDPGFSESQYAGLEAILRLARAEAPLPSVPAVGPCEPEVESPPSPAQTSSDLPALPELTVAPAATVVDSPRNPVRGANRLTSHFLSRRPRTSPKAYADWKRYSSGWPRGLPLMIILTVEVVLSVRLTWSNTAFPDEALYLWGGHLEWAHWLHGTPTLAFPTFFSGAPIIYPPLGALADSIGGLAGARLLSLCFMLCATILLHGVTRRVFDRRTAAFTAALFAGLSATQYLGAFATYDAMALLLLAFATWIGVRTIDCRLRARLIFMVAAASVLALADATKYAATLFDPVVIAVLGLLAWRSYGWRQGVATIITVSYTLGMLLSVGIHLGGHPYWQGITTTTLTRASGTYPISFLLLVSIKWMGIVAILAIIGTIATACNRLGRVSVILAGVLTTAAFLVPTEQARIHTYTSLFKHVGFGGWFACIPAGYAVASLARAVPRSKIAQAIWVGVATVCLTAVPNTSWAASHYGWPNLSHVIPKISTVLASTRGPVLADDRGNVLDYYLPGQTAHRQIFGTFFFAYHDSTIGKHLIGANAYSAAVHERFFSVIMLEFWDTSETDDEILRDLEAGVGYRLAATIPYRATGQHGNVMIWVRQDRP